MKSILLSIKPKYVELIASGQKTIEVRKTAPQEVPFKCYIYCTFPKKPAYTLWLNRGTENKFLADGKVIGEFICDRIDEYKYVYCDHPEIGYPVGYDCGDNWYDIDDEDLQKACLTEEEFKRYGNGKPLYGWHISDLKIYDRPKELSEFNAVCRYINEDKSCHFRKVMCPYQQFDYNEDGSINIVECSRVIIRPPQSWMRVEDLGEEE